MLIVVLGKTKLATRIHASVPTNHVAGLPRPDHHTIGKHNTLTVCSARSECHASPVALVPVANMGDVVLLGSACLGAG